MGYTKRPPGSHKKENNNNPLVPTQKTVQHFGSSAFASGKFLYPSVATFKQTGKYKSQGKGGF